MRDRKGYVYVLTNQSMPDLVKIGRSINGGRTRGIDMYKQAGTAIPTPFNLEFEVWVDDCVSLEENVHKLLDSYRVNGSREFFNISVDESVKAILSLVSNDFDFKIGSPDIFINDDDFYSIFYKHEEILREIGIHHPVLIASALQGISKESLIIVCQEYLNACNKRKSSRVKGGNHE